MKRPPWTTLAALTGLVLKKSSKTRQVSLYSWQALRKGCAGNDMLVTKRIIDKV